MQEKIKWVNISLIQLEKNSKVVIKVWDKACRDELLKRFKLSPARPRVNGDYYL